MWPEDMFSSTFVSGKVIRVVVFDTGITILCCELHCVSRSVFTSEAIHTYFSGVGGSGRMASQSATPARGLAWGAMDRSGARIPVRR